MSRTHLLGAVSAAALACLSTAHATTPVQGPAFVQGGGSTLAYYDYISEFSLFNTTITAKSKTYSIGTYLSGVGSGTGQKAFLNDDYTCDQDKSTSANGGTCLGYGSNATNTVDYGASDAILSGGQLSTWANSSLGQTAAGDLIQIPTLGVGVAMVVNNAAVTANGGATLSKHDICEVFSGGYTNFNQITDAGVTLTPGTITVTYRSDSSGTTFLLTNYLSSCSAGTDTPTGFSFTATTTFSSLFTGPTGAHPLPGNFNAGESGSQNVANFMGGCVSGTQASAITYLSPDYTSLLDSTSQATVCSAKSTLLVANVYQGTKKVLPTYANVEAGLKASVGTNITPPTGTAVTNPTAWIPVITGTTAGYPVVGYTTMDFAQCYADPKITATVLAFLHDHYAVKSYATIQANNGFVGLTNTKSKGFIDAIQANILTNASGANANIGNTTACAGLTGR